MCRLISGPEVDIYVGKKWKHYGLPVDLLCFHSRIAQFKEAKTQRLELLEDKIGDFEILLEFMLGGSITNGLAPAKEAALEETIGNYIDFIKYADKYDMGYIGEEAVLQMFVEAVETWANCK